MFNIFCFVADWLNIPIIAFPLVHFKEGANNVCNAKYVEIEDMKEELDKLNLKDSDEIIVLGSYMHSLEDSVEKFLKAFGEYHANRFTK